MHRTRWRAVALVVPTIAAIGIACDQRTPTETLRPGAANASPTFDHSGDDDGDNDRLRAVPFVFIGRPSECGGVPATPIVTSAWLGGMGLPDNNGPNDASNPNDPRIGLLLSKNGVSVGDCSSAGARILGVRGMRVDEDFELGFDYRDGGHCGAGAPRFNVAYRLPNGDEGFSFVGGCGNTASLPAPQDLDDWKRVRFSMTLQAIPPIPPGSRIQSITLLQDEGTDTPTPASGNDHGIGLAVVDNIYIDGRFIRRGSGIASGRGDGNRDRDDDNRDG